MPLACAKGEEDDWQGLPPIFQMVAFRTYLVVDIEDTLLDFIIDFSRRVYEGFFHVCRGLGRRLHENQSMLPGKRLALLSLYVPTSLEVTRNDVHNVLRPSRGHRGKQIVTLRFLPLVSNEHDNHVGVGMLPGIL